MLSPAPTLAVSGVNGLKAAPAASPPQLSDNGQYLTNPSPYPFSHSKAPGGSRKPRPKDKIGKDLCSCRRVPVFTKSALPQNQSNLAEEAIVAAEAETDQQMVNAPRKPKRRPKKTLKALSNGPAIHPAIETFAHINRLIRGEGDFHHGDPAPAQQPPISRVFIDLNRSPVTSHFGDFQPTSSLTQDWNQPLGPAHNHPHNRTHSPPQRAFHLHISGHKGWATRKDVKMVSQYVPPHLRRGYNCNLPPMCAAGDEIAEVTADHTRLALRDRPTTGGSSGVNKRSPNIVKQVFSSPQNLATPPQTPGQQHRPDNEVQEISIASTKQATGITARIGSDTPASSPPCHEAKKQVTTKKVEFQMAGRPEALKGYRWPKIRDMRAPLESSSSDCGASVEPNSNDDPACDIKKLTDWEGNWLPAPVEWEGRGGFSDRNFYDRLEAWINKSEKVSEEDMDISNPAFVAETNGEVAPHFWIPYTLDAESPQSFWRTYQSRAPAPLSDCDPAEQPWWETYTSTTSALLPPITAPEAKLDTVEVTYALALKDFGSNGAIKKRGDAKKEKKARAAERRRRKAQERDHQALAEPFVPIDKLFRPRANIYLRPAYLADIAQITGLYNYYVANTIHCPEFNPRTTQNLVDRSTNILTNGLPWIVAVDRSKGTRLHASNVTHIPERIVGFAYADDFCDPGSMYRYTVELEIYVHPDFCHQGIGSCLLDKMLNLMDIEYQARAAYEWIVKADQSFQSVGNRVVKSVTCQVPYDARDNTEITWTAKFLRSFGFKKAGNLECMGFKCGKIINVATFQYITSEEINVGFGPIKPL